ncbi:HD-GYP domain-containing protein [Acidovorax sp. BL-A-41-H1]|uniref:HD-GYP domain-containing protein n=1 Tax=Acidovorax sp. BL-A-41-H1 TaxID=3421102 RepID=UPI003F78EA18
MNLVSLSIESIQLGNPLPFALRGNDGALLAKKGYVVRSREELATMVGRGRQLCVDTDESGESYRAYLAQLQRMLIADTNLGEIAAMKMSAAEDPVSRTRGRVLPDWPELQLRTTQLLRAPSPVDFAARFRPLLEELARHCATTPDATLLALVYLSAQESRMYSATHAMLVSCACMLVGREMFRWPDARVHVLGAAGLTMNIGMSELQDQLAQQSNPLTAQQVAAIEAHSARSEAMLRSLGVADAVWLEAVRCHHHRIPGPLAGKSEGQQMARLIQRADVFGARLAPRAARLPMPVTAAMQASYYDEAQQVDEAGASLVKTLGVYPPGSFVRLASKEVGVVIRRGVTATTPRVAVLTNRDGMPTGEPIPRDTGMPPWKVTGVVAARDVRVSLPLDRLLTLA